jgi:hypothetical protein
MRNKVGKGGKVGNGWKGGGMLLAVGCWRLARG